MRNAFVNVALIVLGFAAASCGGKRDPLRELASASTERAEMSRAIPILKVQSLRSSQAYFRDKLGFKVDWEHGDPPDFGAVVRGESTIFLCQGCQGSGGAWMMIFTKDVDRLYGELRGRGANIRMPPKTMPWHLREMHVTDVDGNVIRFGSHSKH